MEFSKEIQLVRPVTKLFLTTVNSQVFREGLRELTLPDGRTAKRMRQWSESVVTQNLVPYPADTVRITNLSNSKDSRCLMVRFVYGRYTNNTFEKPAKSVFSVDGKQQYVTDDAGLVFNGRGYVEANFCHCEPSETEILTQMLRVLSFIGNIRDRVI